MATQEQGTGGNGRGTSADREEMMRDPEMMRGARGWRGRGFDVREDLDRRTDREDIDRRHDWHRGGGGFRRMEGDLRSDLDRRTNREEIDRRHDWGHHEMGRGEMMSGRGGEMGRWGRGGEVYRGGGFRREEGIGGRMGEGFRPERSWGGGSPGNYGMGGYAGEEYGGSSAGFGRERGYGNYGGGMGMGRHAEEGGGYGGYGAGEYGGSYGGMGPGPEGSYGAAGSWGGTSGAGSLMGTYGGASGWEPERMGMRPSAFSLHSMMMGERGEAAARRRGWQREGPLVRDIMTRDPKTVGPDTSVREAARMMREEDAGIMPVCVDGRVIGVVTDRDLTTRVLSEGRDPNGTRVSEVMSEDVHVVTADDRITDAVRIMGEENVRRLPVVDRDDRIKGMLSMTDIAREAELDYALQEALEQIASRRSFWSRW